MAVQKQTIAKLALLACVIAFVIFFSRQQGQGHTVALGDSVPDFTLQKNNGQAFNLQDYRGKVVVLNFWASWCGPCVDELPSLEQFAGEYGAKGIQVVGVSLDEDSAAYMKFITDHQINFLTLRDPSHHVAENYGTFKIPETYIISPEGRLLNKIGGPTDWSSQQMTSYFDSLVAKTPATPPVS